MKFLSALLVIAGAIVLLFALVVHVVNNIKGIGQTQWDWKVNSACCSIAAVFFYFAHKLWN